MLLRGECETICHCCILQEIAEPLADLKQGIAELRQSVTLKCILCTLLAVGNFLNGTEVVASHNLSLASK